MQGLKNETVPYYTEVGIDLAFQDARQKKLPVLIDYWAPGCKGCKKMDLTTYQDNNTVEYIQEHFVFAKYNITNRVGKKVPSSAVLWTPCLIVFANDGSEVRKISGYLNDAQFEGEMEIGRALALLRKAQSQAALDLLERFIVSETCEGLKPEAMYWAGVASYFLNKRNSESLIPFWQKLIKIYPTSLWATKADCLDVVIQ